MRGEIVKILSVVGARPNFIKILPFINAIESHNNSAGNSVIHQKLVHTGDGVSGASAQS